MNVGFMSFKAPARVEVMHTDGRTENDGWTDGRMEGDGTAREVKEIVLSKLKLETLKLQLQTPKLTGWLQFGAFTGNVEMLKH